MSANTDKPVMLTEYGVDAYHDECGGSQGKGACYNTPGNSSLSEDGIWFQDKTTWPNHTFWHFNASGKGLVNSSYVDEDSQALFAVNLTAEIQGQSSALPNCQGAGRGSTACSCIGGFLMSWIDENWKGAKSQAACDPPLNRSDPSGFDESGCMPYAHVECGNWNFSQHSLCGYYLGASPDQYVNEEWFGMNAVTQCGEFVNDWRGVTTLVNALEPRKLYWTMRKLWSGKDYDANLFPTCEQMLATGCSLTTTHNSVFLPAPEETYMCSGRGSCITDLSFCGAGDGARVATPCCKCEPGMSGDACQTFDARVFVAFGAGGTLSLLMLLMVLMCAAKSLYRRIRTSRPQNEYGKPLLSG